MIRRWARIIVLLALLIVVAFAVSPTGRLMMEALTLLADVWMVARSGGDEAGEVRANLSYEGPAGEARIADLYCDPSLVPGGRLLLVHGLVDTGKDDLRLRNLGAALARHRYQVMIPDLPGMRSLRAGRQDIIEIESALQALRTSPHCAAEPVDGDLPVGVVGFSYSSGPVLLALDRQPGRAAFAVLFGGYYDLAEVILFLTTGRHRHDGTEHDGEFLPAGRWSLLEANAPAIADRADRDTLVALARRRRSEPDEPIDDLVSRLGSEGRAAYDLMINTDPGRFASLLSRTDPQLQKTIIDLSPSRQLGEPLDIDLYLLHGRGDIIVPYTQSFKLAEHVEVSGRIRLALLGGFRHARPEESGAERPWWSTALRNPGDSLRLLGVLRGVLRQRAEP